jgi:hypothetical protein
VTIWTWAWIFWLVIFFAIEIPAALNNTSGDTLTENIRSWFSIKHKGRAWRIRRIALLSLLAWLVVHFLAVGFV